MNPDWQMLKTGCYLIRKEKTMEITKEFYWANGTIVGSKMK